VDASSVLGKDKLNVFLSNRHVTEAAHVRVHLADRDITALDSAELLTGPDAKAANSFEQPDVVVSRPFAALEIAEGKAATVLPPLSVAAMTFRLA
jgi:alpha-N-arabinofuranosidase